MVRETVVETDRSELQHRRVAARGGAGADLSTGEALTPRHRFRVASHTKSFTAAGILKLREQGKLIGTPAYFDVAISVSSVLLKPVIATVLSLH